MAARIRIEKLGGDADRRAGLAHAAFKHVSDTEIAPDLAHVNRLTFVAECGVARDHEQVFEEGQFGNDLFGQPIDEIILFGIAGKIVERQNRDRRTGR